MSQEQFIIGRFNNYGNAAQFARGEAARRRCSCVVRRGRGGHFDVMACLVPPIKDLFNLAVEAQIVDNTDSLDVLRIRCIKEGGLSPAGWTFVSKHGASAFAATRQAILCANSQFVAALRLLDWQAAAQLNEPLPNRLAEQLVAAMGILITDTVPVDPRLARAAVDQWSRLDELSRERFAVQEWLEVFVWMRDNNPQLDKNQWKAGWPAIARQYQAWVSRMPVNAEWEPPLSSLRVGQWRIRALDSAIELAREGVAMRHCVARYADQCRAGNYSVYSVIDLKTSKPVATIGIKLEEGEWQLHQVKGQFNREPPDSVAEAAQTLIQQVQYCTGGASRSGPEHTSLAVAGR